MYSLAVQNTLGIDQYVKPRTGVDVQIMAPAEVVAARAATAGSEHGAVGGAAGPGSVRHTRKKRALSPLLFPPATVALWEDDHTVVGHGE